LDAEEYEEEEEGLEDGGGYVEMEDMDDV